MSSIEKIAMIIGDKTKENLNLDSDQVEIIVYGAINILQTINSIFWVIAFGFLTGTLFESLMFSISAGVLRKYSGGGHASSPMRCAIIGAVTSAIAGLFIDKVVGLINIRFNLIIVMVLIACSIIIIIKKAPVDSVEKPIDSKELKKSFKIKSILLVCIYFLISMIAIILIIENKCTIFYLKMVESLIVGMMWQCITLTKSGIFIINYTDKILKYII